MNDNELVTHATIYRDAQERFTKVVDSSYFWGPAEAARRIAAAWTALKGAEAELDRAVLLWQRAQS